MTLESLEKLPALLTRQEFLNITGLTDDKLRTEVSLGLIRIHRSKPGGYAKYHRADAAKFLQPAPAANASAGRLGEMRR